MTDTQWPILPNWVNPFTETWEYKTEIITARSGREQRIAQRTTPRKTIEYTAHVNADSMRQLSGLLDGHQHEEFIVAEIPRHMIATSVVSEDADEVVSVDAIPDWVQEGIAVSVVSGRSVALRHIGEIDEGDGTITFSDTAEDECPAGSYICFGLGGYLDSNIGTRHLTNDVAEVALRFASTPGRDAYIEPPAAAVTYNGKEVFLAKPDWSNPLSVDFDRVTELVDYGRGIVTRYNPVGYGARVLRATYTNKDYATTEDILNTFFRARGQRGEFYMPTWEPDLEMRSNAIATQATLRVKGTVAFESYDEDPVFRNIMILKTDGSRVFKTVSNITEIDDVTGHDSVLTMTSVWSDTISVSDVVMICWMPCYRFASDAITVEWFTDSKSRLQINLRATEELTAE